MKNFGNEKTKLIKVNSYIFKISLVIFFSFFFLKIDAQDLSIQTGHSSTITDLQFTPNNKYLVSCGTDNKVIIWDMTSFMQMKILTGHRATVNSIAMHPTKNIFATASDDNTIKVWDYPDGNFIKEYKFTMPVKAIDYSPDGKTLVCATDSITFIDLNTNKRTRLNIKARKTYSTVKYSSNNTFISFGGKNEYFVHIYELTYQNFVNKFRAQTNSVIFSNDNKFVFSAGDNGVIKRRQINDGTEKKYTFWANNNWDTFFDIIQTDKYFIAANRNNLIYIYDNETGKRLSLLSGHTMQVHALCATSNGKYIASAGKDRKIVIWNLDKFAVTKVIEGGANSITSMAFSNDGDFMFLTYNDGSNRVWNLANKGQMLTNNPPEPNFMQKNFLQEYSSVKSFHTINPSKIFVVNTINKINRKSETVEHTTQKPFIWDIQNFGDQIFIKNSKKDIYKKYFITDTNSIIEVQFNATHLQSKSLWGQDQILDRQTVYSADVYIYAFSKKIKKRKIKTDKDLFEKKSFTIEGDVYFVDVSANGEYLIALKDTEQGLICDLWDLVLSQKISTVLLDKKYDMAGYSPTGYYFYLASTTDSLIKIYRTSSQLLIDSTYGIAPLTFSSNDKLLSYTDKHKNLYLRNFRDKTTIFKTQTGHQTEISDIKFNLPHNYIATSGYDGLIKFWNIDNGEAIISLAAFDKTDFIYVDTNNYYYSTKGAMKYISFVLKNQLYTFDQFDIKYNRPDTVLAQLDYTSASEIEIYKKAYNKRLKKMGFTNSIFDQNFNIPEVNITNQADIPISTDVKTLTIKINASDSIYNLDRINIWVNSVPVFGTNGKIIKNLNQKEYSNSYELTLSNGKNKIDVTATNSQGSESLKKSFSIICETEAPSDLYIISIGVSDYKDTTLNLDYAEKDASDIIDLLSHKNKIFSNIHSYKIVNQDATKDNILSMKNILLNTNVDDEVILFFAGHGTLDQQYNYYLTTHEFDFFDFYNTVIRYEDFINLVDSIPARKKVVFIDACHSGEVDVDNDDNTTGSNDQQNTQADSTWASGRSLWAQQFGSMPQFDKTQNSFELMKILFADLRRGSGTTIISSAGGKEYAYESKKIQNGVFTYSLIAGLKSKKADLNNDGLIMLSEIQDYVMQSVSELTKGRQNPTNRRENLDYDFVIWK